MPQTGFAESTVPAPPIRRPTRYFKLTEESCNALTVPSHP